MNCTLNAFPKSLDGPLPPFNDSGALAPGDYAPTRAEFEARFVIYGDSDRRRAVYDGWNRHRVALLSAGLLNSGRQLLNGSYTTSKLSPGDIDIAGEVPVDEDTLPLFRFADRARREERLADYFKALRKETANILASTGQSDAEPRYYENSTKTIESIIRDISAQRQTQ